MNSQVAFGLDRVDPSILEIISNMSFFFMNGLIQIRYKVLIDFVFKLGFDGCHIFQMIEHWSDDRNVFFRQIWRVNPDDQPLIL